MKFGHDTLVENLWGILPLNIREKSDTVHIYLLTNCVNSFIARVHVKDLLENFFCKYLFVVPVTLNGEQ